MKSDVKPKNSATDHCTSPKKLSDDWRIRAPKPDAEFQRWLAKYLPVERAIMAERDRREELRQKRRLERRHAFGDFCEATEGRAATWRKDGFESFELALDVATDAFTRKTAERYMRLSGVGMSRLSGFGEIIYGLILMHLILSLNASAVIGLSALELFIKLTTVAVARLKHRAIRPLYYEKESARRRALAADRRRITKRTTLNSCPTREMILDAYLHRKDSKEHAIKFGSIIHDLECYVDNSLRFADGRITGRNEGVKGWLSENIPALASKYTTVMRYKAAAKKLKQLVELEDPVPAEAVLAGHDSGYSSSEADHSTEKPGCSGQGVGNVGGTGVPDEKTLRAIAIYRELADGVKGATQMMARIDAFLDPSRVEEATTLAVWRERYRNEITVRNKSRWWRRLCGARAGKSAKQAVDRGEN